MIGIEESILKVISRFLNMYDKAVRSVVPSCSKTNKNLILTGLRLTWPFLVTFIIYELIVEIQQACVASCMQKNLICKI